MDMMWGMPGMMVVAGLFWVLLIAALVIGIWWLLGQRRPPEGAAHRDSALEILRQRYARGEIDREEFESRRRDLVA